MDRFLFYLWNGRNILETKLTRQTCMCKNNLQTMGIISKVQRCVSLLLESSRVIFLKGKRYYGS